MEVDSKNTVCSLDISKLAHERFVVLQVSLLSLKIWRNRISKKSLKLQIQEVWAREA